MHNTTKEDSSRLDEIIRMSNQIDKGKYESGKWTYIIDSYNFWETEDEKTRRMYKDGEITKNDAFLELL